MRECCLCYGFFENKCFFSLVCGHPFCIDCVKLLVKSRNRKCPLCKTKITWTLIMIEESFKKDNKERKLTKSELLKFS